MSRVADLKIGESLEEIQLNAVERMDLIKYSGASGDFNPIHTVDVEATKAGLPGIIGHGMWTMGNLSKLFTPYVEEGFIEEYSIRFRGMVFIDDVLTLKATLTEQASGALKFNVVAVNQKEKEVMNGHVVLNVYARQESA